MTEESSWAPGFTGGAGAGSADGRPAERQRSRDRAAAAIIVVASNFLVLMHGSPNPLTARLKPKLACYWCVLK